MKAFKDHIFAVQLSIEQLAKGKIWLYALPSLIVALLFYGIFNFFNNLSDDASTLDSIPLVGGYITSGVQQTIGFASWITDLFYKFFILTLLSPVNCLLSEKIDNEVTGAKFNGGFIRIMNDLLRAIFLLFFTFLLNVLVMSVWWFISWIFGIHLLDGIVYFLISSFFIGFSFYDFSLERYDIGFFGTVGFGFEKMAYMLLTGGLFSLIYMIPHLGLILAPFLLTIVSTIVYLKMNNKITGKQITNIQ